MYSRLHDGQLLGSGQSSESSIRPYKQLNVRIPKRLSPNARLYHFIMLRSVLGVGSGVRWVDSATPNESDWKSTGRFEAYRIL